MIKTWKADKLWPGFIDFYRSMEIKLSAKFLHPLDHYRPFRTTADVNDMSGKTSEPGYSKFIKEVHSSPSFRDIVQDPYGGVSLDQSGWVNLPVFLEATRKYLLESESLIQGFLDPTKLEIKPGEVQYEKYVAGKIIYCDGWSPRDNPFFQFLPFRPVKGELLKIKWDLKDNRIYNRGVFVLPRGNGEAIVGSTYENSDLRPVVTEKGKKYLIKKLTELLVQPFEIIDHYAGLRPSTLDRRPFVGFHPKHETIGMLNGLGTKGVTLAPYFADELISFIEGSGEIDKEADLKRYL